MVVEHLIYARGMLVPLLVADMFKWALQGVFLESWSTHNIIPILKCSDPLCPNNYCTIIIGHILAKLYASILEHALSSWVVRQEHRAQG